MAGRAPPQSHPVRSASGAPRRTLSTTNRPRPEALPGNVAHTPGPYPASPSLPTDPRRVQLSQSTAPTRQVGSYGRPTGHSRSHSATSNVPFSSSAPQDTGAAHHRSVTELAGELLLPSSRYTHGCDVEAEGPSEKKKKPTAVRFPAGDWGLFQEDEFNSPEDGTLTPGGDPRSRVVSAPMQIQDPEWYTERSSSRRQRGIRGGTTPAAGGAGHSRTVSTSEFRAGGGRLLPAISSYEQEQRDHLDDRDAARHRDTFNEILDFATDNDVDVTDIVANPRVDTRALVETVLERVVEQRMRRLEVQAQPGDRLHDSDASTQQQLLTLLTRLLTDQPSPPLPRTNTSPHQQQQQTTTAPTAVSDNAIAMLPGVGRDGTGAWKCNCFFDGAQHREHRELCGARFADTRAFLAHRRAVHRLDETRAVVGIEEARRERGGVCGRCGGGFGGGTGRQRHVCRVGIADRIERLLRHVRRQS